MALDLKNWLTEAGVPADKIDTIVASGAFTTEVVSNIEKGYLRQSDYSKQMDALQKKQTELDAANERLNEEMLAIAEARNAGEPITAQMRKDLADARAEVTRLQTVVTSRATELGLDPKDVLGEVTPPKREDPVQPTVDLKGYVKDADVNKALGNTLAYSMDVMGELDAIKDEHFELTGKRLSTKDILAEVRARASDPNNVNKDGTYKRPVDVRAIWEEKHNIPTVRSEKAKAQHDQEIKEAEERGAQRVRSEGALPGEQPTGRHSPVLTRLQQSAEKSKAAGDAETRHAPPPRGSQAAQHDRVGAAASAFRSGKYRTDKGSGRAA